KRVLGAREVLGHERRRLLTALEAPAAAEALGRLGHVVAPLGLVQLHLLLAVRQEGQVGERLLLAQVRGHRRHAAFHAARLEHLQLGRLRRRHPSGGSLGVGALLHHGLVAALGGQRRRRRLLEAPQPLWPFFPVQLHALLLLLLQALDAVAAAAAKHLLPACREETI
uniref:Uncharacterized protein n=1 Tax=Salvator merianae TaxID=96440 RepID=A0A8D0BIM5_SALMN